MSEKYLTDSDVAAMFGVSRKQVQRRCHAKQWPHLRVGKAYRFTAGHVARIEDLCQVDIDTTPAKPVPVKADPKWGRVTRGRAA